MKAAIVLNITRYSDSGSIVHLYTAEHGRMQYVVYGNKYKGVLRPLSIIDFTSTRQKNAPTQLSTLSSVALIHIPHLLTTDIQRQCIAIFIAEVLIETLRHPMSDQPLFDWLCTMIQHLDNDTEIYNLHLNFLIEYASHLGIGIDDMEHPDWFVQPTSRSERQQRLRKLITYYEDHIDDFHQPKSLEVLMEVFD